MFNLIIVVIVLVRSYCTHDLPSHIHTCSRDDPYLENCLVNAFNTLRPYSRNGIKELNLPSLNQLVIKEFVATQENSMVNYTVSAWNFTIRGVDSYHIKEIKYDPTINETFRIKLDFQPVNLTSEYEMKGRLLDIPVEGKGLATADFATVSATIEIIGEIKNSSNGEYYRVRDVNVKMKIHYSYYKLNGLFNNNEMLENMTNKMINGNGQMITDAVTPVLEILTEEGIMKFMKSLTKTFSYDKLLPRSYNKPERN